VADLYEKKRTSNGVGPVVVNTQKYTSLFIPEVKIKKKHFQHVKGDSPSALLRIGHWFYLQRRATVFAKISPLNQ